MANEKASKYLTDKARKELLGELRYMTDGDFAWSARGSILTAKQFNPKWNGSNDLEGVPIYTGKEVRFRIEAI